MPHTCLWLQASLKRTEGAPVLHTNIIAAQCRHQRGLAGVCVADNGAHRLTSSEPASSLCHPRLPYLPSHTHSIRQSLQQVAPAHEMAVDYHVNVKLQMVQQPHQARRTLPISRSHQLIITLQIKCYHWKIANVCVQHIKKSKVSTADVHMQHLNKSKETTAGEVPGCHLC